MNLTYEEEGLGLLWPLVKRMLPHKTLEHGYTFLSCHPERSRGISHLEEFRTGEISPLALLGRDDK